MIAVENYNIQDVYSDNTAQTTFGFLTSGTAFSPIAILSFGFLCGCGDLWSPATTSISTTWNTSSASLVTGWTGPGTNTPWAKC